MRHSDLATMKSVSDPLPGISRKMISDAMKNIRELMNSILEYFNESPNSYKFIKPIGIRGEVLIHHLENLKRYYEKYGEN